MTGLQTLTARLVLGGVAAVAGLALSSGRWVEEPSRRDFRRVVYAAFLLTRLAIFGMVFLLFGVAPRGDIPAYYFPEASAALRGALPYRDFLSSYAPLHSYVDGAVLLVWRSQLGLILFAICVEFLLLALWLRVGDELFSERDIRVGSVLYVTSAISLQFVAIDGQDNVLVALLILVSLWMAMRSSIVLSGIFTALAVVMVKLIPVFYAPVFFAGLRRRWAWTLGFLGVAAAGYGVFAALHVPLLQPLTLEGPLKSAGTLPYLIESLAGLGFSIGFWRTVMVLVLGLTYGLVWRASIGRTDAARVSSMLWSVAASTLVLLLFANKSWPAYLVLILFPLCIMVASSGLRARVLFALFGIVALVEHSFWATLLVEANAAELHRRIRRGDGQSLFFLLIEVLLLSGYAWLLWKCVGRATGERNDVDRPAGAVQAERKAIATPCLRDNQRMNSLTPGKELR